MRAAIYARKSTDQAGVVDEEKSVARRRHRNQGIRKLCDCARRVWRKCPHPWHFNFKHGDQHFRFTLEREIRKISRGKDGKWRRDRATLGKPITTKGHAESEAERLRVGIKDGSLLEGLSERSVLATLTLGRLLETYEREYLKPERAPSSLQSAHYQIAVIGRTTLTQPDGASRAFADWNVADITTGAIEQFRAIRRPAGGVATNRDLALLRACFNWGIRLDYIERTPFKRGTVTTVKLSRELQRRRRLEPGEAERLLTACGPTIRGVVEAALETGCRKGELLSLQWHQVRSEPRQEVVLPAQKTKTKRDRRIPISTRLAAILTMRRTAPDGNNHPPQAYVFGNEVGQPVKRFTRAWEAAVLKAHGHKPEYTTSGARALTPECRDKLRVINLHFHDLRREAGSRWLDGGVPLQVIRDWLGHANISQTSTYLDSTFAHQHEAMRAYELRLQRNATPSTTGDQNPRPTNTHANKNTQEIRAKLH